MVLLLIETNKKKCHPHVLKIKVAIQPQTYPAQRFCMLHLRNPKEQGIREAWDDTVNFKFADCQKQHFVQAAVTEAGNVTEVFVVHETKDSI